MTDTATIEDRASISEAIAWMNHRAKREIPIVGTPDHPTPWDRRHEAINALIGDWLRAS